MKLTEKLGIRSPDEKKTNVLFNSETYLEIYIRNNFSEVLKL